MILIALLFSLYGGAQSSEIETSADESGKTVMAAKITCAKASASQRAQVDQGNLKMKKFLDQCVAATANSPWCMQLARPNPASASIFTCTYGAGQPHTFVHPDEATWKFAIEAVKMIKELEAKGIGIAEIYNWWRPEPYNKNVGGAPGRHPFGTSIDVRAKTLPDMERTFKQLCAWRKAGRIKAVGYYGGTGLHFGVGDHTANTWGKSCG